MVQEVNIGAVGRVFLELLKHGDAQMEPGLVKELGRGVCVGGHRIEIVAGAGQVRVLGRRPIRSTGRVADAIATDHVEQTLSQKVHDLAQAAMPSQETPLS